MVLCWSAARLVSGEKKQKPLQNLPYTYLHLLSSSYSPGFFGGTMERPVLLTRARFVQDGPTPPAEACLWF